MRPVPLEALDDDILSGLLGYWQERAGERAYPLRADILPEDMAQVLDRLALLEVLLEPPYFSFRLVGGTAQLVLGTHLAGKGVEAVEPKAHAGALSDLCQAVVLGDGPEAREIAITQGPRGFTYRALALPLSTDGSRIDRLLLAISWQGDQSPFSLGKA